MEKKTPLYERHVSLQGHITPFAGYLLPVNYKPGIIAEHTAVRQRAGMFDVSHMGELFLSGPTALDSLQKIMTNDCDGMEAGRIRYSPMCYENGGIVDDLLVYKLAENEYMLVVNAANLDKDREWVASHLLPGTELKDHSEQIGQIALQGPRSGDILKALTEEGMIPKKYYTFTKEAVVAGVPCIVSRNGYTGEFGYEFYCASQNTPKLWDAFLAAGEPFGLLPCGLGSRDTLRLEAGMPLYGHELSPEISPLEADIGMFVKPDKHDFIGKEAIVEKGAPRIRIGLKINERAIAREGAKVLRDGREIGVVTSGTQSPTLGYPIAMALVDAKEAETLSEVTLEVRGRKVAAEKVPVTFYKR